MKMLALLLFAVTVTNPCQPQATPPAQNQPEFKIIKFNWRKLPRAVESKSRYSTDALLDEEYRKTSPDWSKVDELERQKLSQTLGPEASPKDYEYKLEVNNSASKEVVRLIWVYVFTDPITRKELVRHRFDTKTSIRPGKAKKITIYTNLSPPKVVNAQAQVKTGQAWVEAVIVEKVQYSDGSIWVRD